MWLFLPGGVTMSTSAASPRRTRMLPVFMRIRGKRGIVIAAAVLAVGILSFAGGFAAGRSSAPSSGATGPAPDEGTDLREAKSGFRFINPLLLSGEYSEKREFPEYRPLEDRLNALIGQKIRDGKADKISVYFRDLDRGLWTGVNEQESYVAASLFKVPIMIAYFKQAEKDPAVLAKEITVTKADAAEQDVQFIKPAHALQPGRSYTVEELVRHMIIDSDNAAMNALIRDMEAGSYREILGDLGIDPPEVAPRPYRISPKKYSLLFTVLFNATYLNQEMSEKALLLLNESDFRDGLVAGVPKGIAVAHKFGEAEVIDNGEFLIDGHYLNDCGIVYVPGRPYLLCVMTHGMDLDALKEDIKDVSAAVYDDVLKAPGT